MPIREYRINPEHMYSTERGKWSWVWRSRISINLRFVAAAEPWNDCTSIAVAGSQVNFVVEAAYVDFVNDWMAALKASP